MAKQLFAFGFLLGILLGFAAILTWVSLAIGSIILAVGFGVVAIVAFIFAISKFIR